MNILIRNVPDSILAALDADAADQRQAAAAAAADSEAAWYAIPAEAKFDEEITGWGN